MAQSAGKNDSDGMWQDSRGDGITRLSDTDLQTCLFEIHPLTKSSSHRQTPEVRHTRRELTARQAKPEQFNIEKTKNPVNPKPTLTFG